MEAQMTLNIGFSPGNWNLLFEVQNLLDNLEFLQPKKDIPCTVHLVKATNSKLLGTKILEIFDFFEYLT
jgi:hypothetical protein